MEIVIAVLLALLYFLPYFEAVWRRHPRREAIGALNLFAGWTVAGWVGALVWALTAPPRAPRPKWPALLPENRPPTLWSMFRRPFSPGPPKT